MNRKCWIMGITVLLVAVLCFGLTGCSKIENPATVPFGNSDFAGMDKEEAVAAIREAGFVNIQENVIKPFLGKAGTVQGVSIDGETLFSKGRVWENSVPVIVTYYEEIQEEPEPEPEPVKSEPIEVTFNIEVTGEEGKPVFEIETNLPDDTELDLSLLWDDKFNYEDQTAVVKDGKAQSEPFTDNGGPLSGYSAFGITMFPANQTKSVQAVIGEHGEYITGPMVETVDGYSYVWMEKSFNAEPEEQQETNISEEDMKAIIERSLATGFGDDCSVSLDGTVYTVNAWQDGLAVLSVLAQNGDASSLAAWEQITQTTVDASEQLQKLLEENGLGDHIAVVNIVNDANKENILLTAMYGMVFYDCVS